MPQKNKLIPFWMLPYSWGVAGKTREIAKAEYELSGYDLEQRLLEIKKDDLPETEYKTMLIELDHKYNKINSYTYKKQLAETISDEHTRKQALLLVDYENGKITELEYNKTRATLNKEPWVTVLNMDFSKKDSLEGSFELDWNEFFVEKLTAEGYQGSSPDHIVNQWFMEVCKNIALEEFDGTGNFSNDADANIQAMKRWGASSSRIDDSRKGYQ